MLGDFLGCLGYGNMGMSHLHLQGTSSPLHCTKKESLSQQLQMTPSHHYHPLALGSLHLGLTLGPHLHEKWKKVTKERGLKPFEWSWLGSSRVVNFVDWRSYLIFFAPCFSPCHAYDGSQQIGNQMKMAMASYDSGDDPSKKRTLTNILIGLNILIFAAKEASNGRLLVWGAKVNSMIDHGQLWRLLTSAFLHANIGHLLINCYSLNSLGPVVEALEGRKRYFALYIASAISGSTMSYLCSKQASVGASGAIFGLVGALAVFLLRHRKLINEAPRRLSEVGQVIAINLVLGLISNNVDNWGHVGGLLGGVAVSWLLGPSFSWEYSPKGGHNVLVDRPPISLLIPQKKKQ